MNGAPLPPIPDVPPFPLEAFLALTVGVALLVALVWFIAVQHEIREERTREEKKRVLRTEIESLREQILDSLIEQSPGGRKPWQDRRS